MTVKPVASALRDHVRVLGAGGVEEQRRRRTVERRVRASLLEPAVEHETESRALVRMTRHTAWRGTRKTAFRISPRSVPSRHRPHYSMYGTSEPCVG